MTRPIAISLAAVILAATPAVASRLNLKPGLWKIRSTIQRTDLPILPPVDIPRMSPRELARFQADRRARATGPAIISASTTCITRQDIENRVPLDPSGGDKACQAKILESTSTTASVHIECSDAGTASGDWKFGAPDPAHLTATMKMTMSMATHTITINGKFQGTWLRASCAGAKQ